MYVGNRRGLQFSTLVLILFAALVLLPILFVAANSFMSAQEAAVRYTGQTGHYAEFTLWPRELPLSAYKDALLNDPATTRLFLNSMLLTVPILLGQLIVSPLAAYAFEMMRPKGKEALYALYVAVMLMPIQDPQRHKSQNGSKVVSTAVLVRVGHRGLYLQTKESPAALGYKGSLNYCNLFRFFRVIAVSIDMRLLPIIRNMIVAENRVVFCFCGFLCRSIIQQTGCVIVDVFQIFKFRVHPLSTPDQSVSHISCVLGK